MTVNKLPSVSLLIAINLSTSSSTRLRIRFDAIHLRAPHTRAQGLHTDVYECALRFYMSTVFLSTSICHTVAIGRHLFFVQTAANQTTATTTKKKTAYKMHTASIVNLHSDECHAINFDCVYLSFRNAFFASIVDCALDCALTNNLPSNEIRVLSIRLWFSLCHWRSYPRSHF